MYTLGKAFECGVCRLLTLTCTGIVGDRKTKTSEEEIRQFFFDMCKSLNKVGEMPAEDARIICNHVARTYASDIIDGTSMGDSVDSVCIEDLGVCKKRKRTARTDEEDFDFLAAILQQQQEALKKKEL